MCAKNIFQSMTIFLLYNSCNASNALSPALSLMASFPTRFLSDPVQGKHFPNSLRCPTSFFSCLVSDFEVVTTESRSPLLQPSLLENNRIPGRWIPVQMREGFQPEWAWIWGGNVPTSRGVEISCTGLKDVGCDELQSDAKPILLSVLYGMCRKLNGHTIYLNLFLWP